jgi:carbamoyl-phosphate synthase large subunit
MLSHPKHLNILLTSAGRRVELLHAFRQAYQDLDLRGNIVVTDIDPLAPTFHIADQHYLVPRLTDPEYIPTLVEICQRETIALVFPLIDPDIPVLSTHRDTIEALGAQLAVVPSSAADIVTDKWLTYQFFQHLGIPRPRSWLPEHLASIPDTSSLFVKPRFGSAAKKTFRVQNEQELKFFLEYIPDPIIQEYVSGNEITNDIVCDLDSSVLAVVSRHRIEVRWGEVAKGVTVYNPDITEQCLKIAEGLPAVGPITAQCIVHQGTPVFLEINARLGGGFPLGIAAGATALHWLLARVAGIAIEIPPLGTYQTGLYLTRFDDSYFLSQEDYENMARRRL